MRENSVNIFSNFVLLLVFKLRFYVVEMKYMLIIFFLISAIN